MTEKYLISNDKLIPFFKEINKYAEGVHVLNEGASLKSIEQVEQQINVRLPKIYKDFLHTSNGGELFAVPSGTVLCEVYDVSSGPRQKGGAYLDEVFMPQRRWPGMRSDYLIIADKNFGDTICIDISTSNGDDAEIIQWDHEIGEVSSKWEGLVDWLMEELEMGALHVNYNGSDKE